MRQISLDRGGKSLFILHSRDSARIYASSCVSFRYRNPISMHGDGLGCGRHWAEPAHAIHSRYHSQSHSTTARSAEGTWRQPPGPQEERSAFVAEPGSRSSELAGIEPAIAAGPTAAAGDSSGQEVSFNGSQRREGGKD